MHFKFTEVIGVAFFLLSSGCILPSARPVAYTPRPEQAQDPEAILRELAQPSCKQGVEVTLLGDTLQYTSPCSTTAFGKPNPTRIDLARLTDIRIFFGDWYQLRLVMGTAEDSPAVLAFSRQEDAERAVDAIWALRNRLRR